MPLPRSETQKHCKDKTKAANGSYNPSHVPRSQLRRHTPPIPRPKPRSRQISSPLTIMTHAGADDERCGWGTPLKSTAATHFLVKHERNKNKKTTKEFIPNFIPILPRTKKHFPKITNSWYENHTGLHPAFLRQTVSE